MSSGVGFDNSELLGRPVAKLPQGGAYESIRNRVVLITGAAGSIGSELARQAAVNAPHSLLLVDIHEAGLYDLEMEMKHLYPNLTVVPLLMDVRDYQGINHVFREYAVDVVFHAAALKQVPMLEVPMNGIEAVRTNVFGTGVMVNCAREFQIKQFVLVSTDKAVYPSSFMGMTKRVAELYCDQAFSVEPGIDYTVVRFGNVLGSAGSVIPLFRKQIARGGPVTVTHEHAVRYFMTISEAVSLILQTSSFEKPNGMFILEMGHLMKVMDLAVQMIEMAGLRPGVDIPIEIIGLRPGEKLFEELHYRFELVTPAETLHIKNVQTPLVLKDDFGMLYSGLQVAVKERKIESMIGVVEAIMDIRP